MGNGFRPYGPRRARCAAAARTARVLPAVLLMMALVPAVLAGCGSGATDANEPNDELGDATVLAPGASVDGVIGGSDDGDVFQCEVPAAGGSGEDPDADGGTGSDVERRAFVVTVQTAAPDDLELQVGASIPGVWEAITWPGWAAVVTDDGLELSGTLGKGTVLVFLKGAPGTEYSIAIVWD